MTPPLRLQTNVWNPLGTSTALLLHGAGADGGTWWRLASALAAAGWLVVAPDLRSHGRSPTGDDHSMEVLAADVALLGDRYDLVVGHGLGGAVAARLLCLEGFSDAAVLVDPPLRLEPEVRDRLWESLRARTGVDVGLEALRAGRPWWDERDLQRALLAARTVTRDVIDALFEANVPWDVLGSAENWGGRVHLLAGDPERGALLPPGLLQTLLDGDRVTGEIVTGAGHLVQHERPDVVWDAVSRVAGPFTEVSR